MNAWSLAVCVITVLAVLVLVVYEPVCTLPAYAWTPWRTPRKITVSYGWAPVTPPHFTPSSRVARFQQMRGTRNCTSPQGSPHTHSMIIHWHGKPCPAAMRSVCQEHGRASPPSTWLETKGGCSQVVGLLVLLAAGQADGTTLKQGIVGDDRIKPYNIVIIFMSQARHR